MDLGEKKVLMVIAPENFRDEEYFHTREAMESKGIEVEVASLTEKAVSSIDKKEVDVDFLLDDVTGNYDGIVFVGGGGAKVYFDNKRAHELAEDFYNDEKVVAAICIAPMILAHAGVLKDKKATIWDGSVDELKTLGVSYSGEDVTVDGNIVTANGPKAAFKFGETVADVLKK